MRLLKRPVFLIALACAVACTGSSPNQPVPSVRVVGADLHCQNGDHGYEDPQAGWGFCYPGTWKYLPHTQASGKPAGEDSTFDITDDSPCSTPPPSARPSCPPQRGLFAFMLISTYERGTSATLNDWVAQNETQSFIDSFKDPTSISWGDSLEALVFGPNRIRMALTKHHVVVLELRSGSGLLDLEKEMSTRLNTWRFTY